MQQHYYDAAVDACKIGNFNTLYYLVEDMKVIPTREMLEYGKGFDEITNYLKEKVKEEKKEVTENIPIQLDFSRCSSLKDYLLVIFNTYGNEESEGLASFEVIEIAKYYKVPYVKTNIQGTVSSMAKQKLLYISGKKVINHTKRDFTVNLYKIVSKARRELVEEKPKEIEEVNSPENNLVDVDELFSKMRAQLINDLAPLLCVKKQFMDAKTEISELLEEISGLKGEIEKRDAIITSFSSKMSEQYDKIIEDFAKFFGITKEKVLEVFEK